VRPFAIWLAAFVVVFGIFAFATNSVRGTDDVFVLVDSSFEMQDVWTRVAVELDRIDDERYSEFALATEKSAVHGYQERLRIGDVVPFAPCDNDRVDDYPQIETADRLVLITREGSCLTEGLEGDWEIIELEP
jgi:hypothetical protein